MDLKQIILDSEMLLESEFGFGVKESKYFFYSKTDWNKFCVKTKSNNSSEGIFFPRNLTTHLKQDSEFLTPNFLHEYYGHGLFCELSITGKEIVFLEKQLQELEHKILFEDNTALKNKVFLEEHSRKKSELESFFSENHDNYEGFAMWLEHFLSRNLKKENLFYEKMKKFDDKQINLFEKFYSYSENIGNFSLIASLGFPKFYDKEKITSTLKKLFREDFETIDFAILYGSKKPYSDIDLFVVSEKIGSQKNSWLDIYAKTKEQLEEGIKNFDISITDPLFSGKTIIGNPMYQEQLKKMVLNQEITSDVIKYNFKKAMEQKEYSLLHENDSKERKLGLGYYESYKKNAEELAKGNKILTWKKIKF